MQLTKAHKRYAAILGICVAGLAVDRYFLSPPAGASAEESAVPVAPVAPVVTADGARTSSSQLDRPTLVGRFDDLRHERGLDPMNVVDVFESPPSWRESTGRSDRPATTSTGAPDEDRFLKSHTLNAVMANGEHGACLLDGRRLQIGQAVDGFVLREVRARSVIFESPRGALIELALSFPAGG